MSGTAASYIADQAYDFGDALRLPRINPRDARQTLTKDLARTGRNRAPKAADSGPQLHQNTLPWQILHAPEIGTVARSRNSAADGTDRLLVNVYNNATLVGIALKLVNSGILIGFGIEHAIQAINKVAANSKQVLYWFGPGSASVLLLPSQDGDDSIPTKRISA